MNNINYIKIQQAYYGEVNKGHGCLNSTIEDSSLRAHLTAFTDRPGYLMAGTIMEPYYSGMHYDGYFIFTLTFPDGEAQRTGMVFTHALIVKLDDLERIDRLENLFELFCREIPENKNFLEEMIIEEDRFHAGISPNTFPKYIISSVQKLANGQNPVVFCGHSEQFIRLICSVWAGIPRSFRFKLSFTAGFTAVNVDSKKTFIFFQKDLFDTLGNIEFVSGENSEELAPESTIDRLLLNPNEVRKFEEFLYDLNVDNDSWKTLYFGISAYEGYLCYHDLNNDALKQLLRQVAKISPNKDDGIKIKEKLLLALSTKIRDGNESNLKSLRNLPLVSYNLGEELVGNSFKLLVHNIFERDQRFNVDLICEILVLAINDFPKNWWHTTVIETLKDGISTKRGLIITNLWSIILKSQESFEAIWNLIPTTAEYEKLLIKYLPSSIVANFAEALVDIATRRNWTDLHAYSLLAYKSPMDAIIDQYHFEREIKDDSHSGSEMIIINLSDSDLLIIALKFADDIFINPFVDRVLRNGVLLKDLNVENDVWLKIWEKTLEVTNDLDYGIINVSESINLLFSRLFSGEPVPYSILDTVAKSKYADISNFENRAELWTFIDLRVRSLFLESTANAILKDVSSVGLSGVFLEGELNNYIATDNYMTTLLNRYKSDINAILEIYEHVSGLKDKFLSDYIRYFSGHLKDMQSKHLGELVRSKGYRLSARQIFEKAKNEKSFRIALEKCKSIIDLGFLDRVLYGHLFGEQLSKEDLYSAVTQICIDLYHQGPEDRDLWQRANGDNSKLYQHKSREDNWRKAIELLRNGGGGKKIDINSLLKVMEEDYPQNTQLKNLIKIIDKK